MRPANEEAAASSPHQPARADSDGGEASQALAGERTHEHVPANVRPVRVEPKAPNWNRRPACWGVGEHAGQCGAVIPARARYCERCAEVMNRWGREVRA